MTGKQFSFPNGLNGFGGSGGGGSSHHATGKPKQFSIEDAFEEETDEAIKVYGSTTTTTNSVGSPEKSNGGNGGGLLCLHPSSDMNNKHTRDNGAAATCIAMDGGPRNSYKMVNEASRDSDSLIQDCYGGGDIASCADSSPTHHHHLSCFRHPKVRENWRMVFAATCLLVLGIILIGFGTVTLAESHKRLQGVVFLLTGFICFLPGIYHVVYIYLAAKGKRGYHFHNLPLFT